MTRLRHAKGDTLSSIIARAIRVNHHLGWSAMIAVIDHFAEAHIVADPATHKFLSKIAGVFRGVGVAA